MSGLLTQQQLMMIVAGAPVGNMDDFSSNSLPYYTQYADTAGTYAISSGLLSMTVSGVQSVLTRNGVSFADGEISCVLTQAYDAGLVLRLQDNNNYYVTTVADASGNIGGGGPQSMRIYKRVGGAYTQVGSTAMISFTRGTSHSMSFSAIGSLLTVNFDGVTKITATDTGISAAGKCGLRANQAPAVFDSFTWG